MHITYVFVHVSVTIIVINNKDRWIFFKNSMNKKLFILCIDFNLHNNIKKNSSIYYTFLYSEI